MSIVSLETLTTGHCDRPSTMGPVHPTSTGPPFAVGDKILCDSGTGWILRAWVLEAEHPRYVLRLDDRSTVDTGNNKCSLFPAYLHGKFSPAPDDPFLDLRAEHSIPIDGIGLNVRRGSFGVVVDAQLDSLRRIREAKESSKAVKAGNA